MADNVEITPGTGAVIATDEVTRNATSEQQQIVKLSLGAEGAFDILVDSGQQTMANSLPVVLSSDHSDVKITLDSEAVVLGAGSAAIGKLAANSGVDIGDVDVTSIAAGDNNIGNVDIVTVPSDPFGANADSASATGSISAKLRFIAATGIPITGTPTVVDTPSTSGGVSVMNASSSDGATALTSTAQAIKASAGQVYGYYIYNPNTAAVFVQFYNTASGSVSVGTTNPLYMLTIPPGTAANLWTACGIAFGTAISWAATSTAGGNGAPTTALDAICFYK